jgi:hypothetical protein
VIPRNVIASLVGAVLALFLAGAAAAADFARSADLCVLPVVRGSPGEADEFDIKRMLRRTVVLPGLPGPVMYRVIRRVGDPVWTVTNGTLEPLGGPFPDPKDGESSDKFAVDGATGRIFGVNRQGEVFVAEPGTKDFRRLHSPYEDWDPFPGMPARPNQNKRPPFSGLLTYLPERQTVLFGFSTSTNRIEGDKLVQEDRTSLYRIEGEKFVLVSDKLPFRFPIQIDTLPKLGALLVTSANNGMAILHDNGTIEIVREPVLSEPGVHPRVVELSDPPRVLVHAKDMLIFPQTQPPPEQLVPQLRRLNTAGYTPSEASAVTGTYLVPSGMGVFRLGPQGYERVPDSDKIYHSRYYDVPSLGIAVVRGGEELRIFDGRSLSPIPDSGYKRLGEVTGVYDLQSIGKVLVATKKGLFELTPQHTLVSIALPGSPDANGMAVVEMPRSEAAILLVANGAYAIGRGGEVQTLPGGNALAFAPGVPSKPLGVVSTTNEFLFTGPGGTSLFRVVDKRTAGATVCAAAEPPPPPASALCFRPIEGTKDEAAGIFVDWGLSPDSDRLLVSSSKGLFQIAGDRSFGRVPGFGSQNHNGPGELPWDSSVFISAMGGPHLVLEKSGRSRPVRAEGTSKTTLFKVQASLPSLRTVVLGGTSYLGPDDTITKFTDQEGKAVVLDRPPVETPWLDGDLVYSWGLKLFKPGEPLRPLVIEGNIERGITAMGNLNGLLHALPRFRSVLVGTRFGWRRLTEDRRLVTVPGLDPAVASILTIADPGRGDILLGTSEGMYRIDDKGTARAVAEAGRGAVRVLLPSSALDGLMIGGDNGLFRWADGRVVPVKQGDVATIGAVQAALDVPWARLTVISAARGFFVLDHEGALTRLDTSQTGGHSPLQPMAAFPALRGVFFFGPAKYSEKGAIYELGRHAESGACTAPL